MSLVDSQGKIAKAKARMSSNCSVRKSKFCSDIISLRLQGISFKRIEEWLREKGAEHHIPAATLYRNLQRAFGEDLDFLPVYEERADAAGGDIVVDAERILAGQVLLQRQRVDYMVRQELERRKTRPGYSNPRIRQEMETLHQLVEGAEKYKAEKAKISEDPTKGNSLLSQDAEDVIADLILNGGVSVPTKKSNLRVV